jgi:hypothetical protein
VKNKIGVRAIYELSATPFVLRGSGYSEGTLFLWVVSDFSLIEAVEAGLVKAPRVPVSDGSGTRNSPTYCRPLPRGLNGTKPIPIALLNPNFAAQHPSAIAQVQWDTAPGKQQLISKSAAKTASCDRAAGR